MAGPAAPLPAANIDTDIIMPKRYLKGVDRAGLREGVFHDLRFGAAGDPDPTFILNQPAWADAAFLVVGPNFGCGSSREHAVWGLLQLGVRALIGTNFAGIFFDNCARNGLVALALDLDQIGPLLALVSDPARNQLTIDLAAQTVTTAVGALPFRIDPLLKTMLLEGLDSVATTLKHQSEIHAFESSYLEANPWLLKDARTTRRQT